MDLYTISHNFVLKVIWMESFLVDFMVIYVNFPFCSFYRAVPTQHNVINQGLSTLCSSVPLGHSDTFSCIYTFKNYGQKIAYTILILYSIRKSVYVYSIDA